MTTDLTALCILVLCVVIIMVLAVSHLLTGDKIDITHLEVLSRIHITDTVATQRLINLSMQLTEQYKLLEMMREKVEIIEQRGDHTGEKSEEEDEEEEEEAKMGLSD